MGGFSVPEPPPEKSQYGYEGDELVSSREVQGDKVISKQIPKAEEEANKKRREEDLIAVEQMMKDFLPGLNTVDPELQKSIDEQSGIMTSQAQENLNKSYQDSIQQLRAMAANRFGSTENTYYDRNFNDLNKQLAAQQAQIAKDIEARRSDLQQQELANRANYYNTLQAQAGNLRQGINDFRDQQANRYNQQVQSAQLSNNFDANNYNTKMNGEIASNQQKNSIWGSIFSDIALKENITPTTPVLDKLNALGVYDYNYKATPNNRTRGIMAQELEQVLPEAVSTDVSGYKQIDPAALVPVLVKAIQELNAKIK